MNRTHVLFHLREAAEELNRTVGELERKRRFGEPELSVAMEHLYHHLNTAWNARQLPQSRINEASDKDFNKWGSYPKDLPPLRLK